MKKIAALSLILPTLLFSNCAVSDTLKTRTEKELGLSYSSYQYEEPNFMSLKGSKLGLDFRGVDVLPNGQYLRLDMRYALGQVDYASVSTGSSTGKSDWYFEARGLVGRDWFVANSVFSPYFGLGYRNLANDMRGLSCVGNTCYWGYRRDSTYIYMPIGFTHRTALSGRGRLVSEIEYDHLMSGKQVSMLSDGGWGYSDLTNTQSSGYGVKFSMMYEKDDWSAGPYGSYWNIDQSTVEPIYQNGSLVGYGMEPRNNTREFGFKASQRF